MGVYIPGIKLPKDEPGAFQVIVMYVGADGKLRAECDGTHEVVSVPPHGRLGDLDALVDWLKLSYGSSIPIVRGLLFSSIIKEIQEYPSVIPAEQKSKEEGEAK